MAVNATHHSHPAMSALIQHCRRILLAWAPYLMLPPLVVVTFYPPCFPYANAVYGVTCVVFAIAIVRLVLRWRKEVA
jgi:hypothetical protein